MRIITGKYKGRRFNIPHTFKARPTTDFAKENIFNVLTGYINFTDLKALDLFAGTGIISLELLSRGCKEVTCVEKDRDHYKFISECLTKIECKNIHLVRGDVFKYIKKTKEKFNFIFADPPYTLPDLDKIPSLVLDNNLLADNGIFVFEHGKQNSFSDHPHFKEHRNYGSVNFTIFR